DTPWFGARLTSAEHATATLERVATGRAAADPDRTDRPHRRTDRTGRGRDAGRLVRATGPAGGDPRLPGHLRAGGLRTLTGGHGGRDRHPRLARRTRHFPAVGCAAAAAQTSARPGPPRRGRG